MSVASWIIDDLRVNTIEATTITAPSISAAGLIGQVQFNGGTFLAADSNLFWDNTNKRLGIGVGSSPSTALSLASAGVLSWNSDTGLSRTAAGAIGIGNGVQGNVTGTLELAAINLKGTTGIIRFYNGATLTMSFDIEGSDVVYRDNLAAGDQWYQVFISPELVRYFGGANNTANAVLELQNGFFRLGSDTSISRDSAGVVDIGNGMAGSKTGTLQLTTAKLLGFISQYNGVTTVDNGVPAEYAKADLLTQGAAIGSTLLYAVPASGAGMYRISWSAKVTRVATTSSVLGGTNGFQIIYTDADDSTVPTTPASVTNNGNLVTTQISGVVVVNAKASTNINYTMDYTSVGATTMQFSLHVKLEKL